MRRIIWDNKDKIIESEFKIYREGVMYYVRFVGEGQEVAEERE